MSAPTLMFAAVVLLPAMTAPAEGTPQLSGAAALVVAMCNGGSMVLPLGSGTPQPATPCCCAKGCRGDRRRRIDRKQ